ncbi:hypothetical protein [Mycolicibacterium elephantis]|uniref:hypothetical protein n=1 Tax=Mycolicibacterium elephantis TaxID=81858 RepID=UPI000FE2329F|nr:hypothetical protein [Mycolicibacterium elephantis]MCV7221533.1 hypothetical protein [Mycolicibacterium elephantis]
MADVHVDVLARVHRNSVDRAAENIKRPLERAGREAGQNFATNFGRGFESRSARIQAAQLKLADATRKVHDEQKTLNRMLDAGEQNLNKLSRASDRVLKSHRAHDRAVRDLRASYGGLEADARVAQKALASVGDSARGVDWENVRNEVVRTGAVFRALGSIGAPVAISAVSAALVYAAGIAASAAQSLWLLPGAVGAAAAGFGTLKIATLGFGDALKDIRDPEKFAEGLRELAPNAQQAALAIQNLLPRFDQLKNAAQNALFADVGQQLTALTNQFLPTIQRMTTGVAGAFNQMLSGVVDQLMTPESQQAISTTVSNIVSAFQNLSGAAGPLTSALANLLATGSDFLPDLASSAAQAAESFAAFVREAQQSGQLKQWISEGLTTVKQLGEAAWQLGEAFMSLAPIGQKILPEILEILPAIKEMMPAISTAAVMVSGTLLPWAKYIELASKAMEGFKGIVEGVGNAVLPIINKIGQAFDAMLEPIRKAIDTANKFSPVDLPNIPKWQNAGPLNLTGPERGGSWMPKPTDPLPTAGIDPFTGLPLPPGATAGRIGASVGGLNQRGPGWGPQGSYFDSPGAARGGSSDPAKPVVPYPNTDPMSLLQGFPVTASLYSAAGTVIDSRHELAQSEAELNALLQRNDATAEEIQDARNDRAKAEREAYEAELRLQEAKQSSTDKFANQMRGAAATFQDISANLDEDLGLSDGLPGLADNLVRFIATLAAAPVLGQLSAIKNASPSQGGHGLFGMLAAQGTFGPQFTGLPQEQYTSQGAMPPNLAQMYALAQHANGGQYDWGGTDLVNGLADCSGAVSELVAVLTGRGVGQGRLFTTDNFAAYAQQNGWQRGYQPGAFNVGLNEGHMAATLPNGQAFESGGSHGGIVLGQGQGALNPTFTDHWFKPVAPAYPSAPQYAPSYAPPAGPPSLANVPPMPGGPLSAGMPQAAPFANPMGPTPVVGQAAGQGGWQPNGGGFGISGDGAIGAGMAAAAGGGMDGGAAAAGVAAQTAMKLIQRTVSYAGQAAGIGVQGLMETFGLDSALQDSWLGRVAAGIAGARPALPNQAGQTQAPLQDQQGQQGQQGQPPSPQYGVFINGDWVQAPHRDTAKSMSDLAFQAGSAWTGR